MIDDAGEAERCLARGFRLDRSNEEIARRLAEVYVQSGRPSEALTVLDMCLREGTESPQLLWDAGLRAASLERHEVAVTYFDRFEIVEPDQAWVHYYRALSLLALEKIEDAAEAIERETTRAPRPDLLHLATVRATVAAGAVSRTRCRRDSDRAGHQARRDRLSDTGWNLLQSGSPVSGGPSAAG